MKRIYMFIMTILCSIGIAVAISYAWFLNDENVDPIAQGRSGSAYFAYGDGGITKPYGINQPRHLYNLAWLVYLFPETYANLEYEIDPSLSGTLNMNGWVLPPIGTDANPFTGYFDGNGKTIENLTTSNNVNNMSTKPNDLSNKVTNNVLNDCDSMGLFGKIAKASNETDAKVHDFYLQGTSVETAQAATCIGIVAGVVDAKIENVGVVNSGLNLGNSSHTVLSGHTNLSDYTVVGYATEDYTTTVADSKTVVYNATTDYDHFTYRGMGSTTAWGGSIDFKTLHGRIEGINTNFTSGFNYIYTSSQYYGESDTNSTLTRSSSDQPSSNTSYKYFNSNKPENGSYIHIASSQKPGQVIYLSSLYQYAYVIKEDGIGTGYKIHDGNGHFLSVSNATSGSTIVTSTETNAATWFFESGHLYTYNDQVLSEDIEYFLNASDDINETLSTTASTTWILDGQAFKYEYPTSSGNYKYLNYFQNNWTTKQLSAISDGNNHYLTYDSSNGFGYTQTVNTATPWLFNEQSDGTFKITNNSGDYLRNNNGTLQCSNTNSNNKWIKNGGYLMNTLNNTAYYLQYDSTDGWHLTTPTTYYIEYGGNYLYANTTNGALQTGGTSNVSDATAFSLESTLSTINGSGKISYIANNTTYYLRYNTNLTYTNDENYATTWNHDAYGIYYLNNSTKYYIQYENNVWKLSSNIEQIVVQFDYYYISYNGYYLNATTSGVSGSTTATTKWYVDSDNYIYTIISGTNYYLYASGSDTGAVSTNKTNPGGYGTVKKSGDSIYETKYSNYKLYWNGSTWKYSNSQNYTLQWVNSESYDDYENTPFGNIVGTTLSSLNYPNKTTTALVSLTAQKYDCTRTVLQSPDASCYIPLKVQNNSLDVDNSNTGYLIGGSRSGLTTTGSYPQISGYGDSRISYFDISRIGNNSFDTTSISNVRTITTINNSVQIINLDDSNYSSYKNNFSKYKSSELDLLKNALYTNYSNGTKSTSVYGIHFMNAPITKNNLVTVKKALINGDEYSDYQMPEDCIDFKLKQSGFINFFAGSYFATGSNSSVSSRNDCFFSINEIKRDESNKIITINHIVKIYGKRKSTGKVDTSEPFVYLYEVADPTTNSVYSNGTGIPSGYEMLFDKDWIETDPNNNYLGQTGSNLTNIVGYVYYFEIPVNDGEFALGSVYGKSGGAYLMYLDIGANAAIVDRTQITQQTETTLSNHVYVNGIQILSTNSGNITASSSYVALIPAGTYNSITVGATSITGSSLNMSYNGTGSTITNGTLVPRKIDGTTHYMTDVGASTTSTTKVLKFIDYNNGTDSAYEITIKKVDSNVATYDIYRIINKTVTDHTAIALDATEYGLLIKGTGTDEGYGVAPASANAVITSNTITFRTTNNDKVLEYYYNNIPWDNAPTVTETNVMTIDEVTTARIINNHSILANSNRYEDGEYWLQHVYRMTGNTITVAIEAPSEATATDYNNTIYVSTYNNTKVEATGDTNPQYVFIINGTTIQSTSTTASITATAYSGI